MTPFIVPGWTGLLIEANSRSFASLLNLKRNAWSSNLCLSPTKQAQNIVFYGAHDKNKDASSGLIPRKDSNTIPIRVNCVPLYSFLLAVNVTTVDYLSLDVEGSELDILKTIPFEKVLIKVVRLEITSIPGGMEALQPFMQSKGYAFFTYSPDPQGPRRYDAIFLHSSVQIQK